MKSNTNVIYPVALASICFLAYILWNIDYTDESLIGPQCDGPGPITIDYVVSDALPALSELGNQGEQLFKANCAACHKVNKTMTGPALLTAIERYPSDTLFLEYIRREKPMEGNYCFSLKDFDLVDSSALTEYIRGFR